ncbi:hypothetical protein [Mesorhizobium sp. M8A.F.Ca.ET.021.01.1.1]|uniref:hypothetical protein n=1 Tax=Mesorhizobium sp. M8A.F.Ca.ET.021.01.1.1 TaxID=2496757 RepID=UPI000FCA16E4|nr:hypothetical protein [Mesorhizobium sp. M8A.F.Ca.ET.021.01.1.1]RUW53738.1 hypothetical protein EOA36_10135 [Mesorhizobium sp. M8A.F.Ca.ET.021.01.1.1]
MDIATGLQLLAQATGIVKDLRDIDKGFDQAALKAQMADLYSTLADVKIALSDARETIHDRDQQIKRLEEKIATLSSGEACALCNEGRLKVVASKPHEHFAFAGVQTRSLKCDNCGHTEERFHDPSGVTKRGR